jgi:hypothetical protein
VHCAGDQCLHWRPDLQGQLEGSGRLCGEYGCTRAVEIFPPTGVDIRPTVSRLNGQSGHSRTLAILKQAPRDM